MINEAAHKIWKKCNRAPASSYCTKCFASDQILHVFMYHMNENDIPTNEDEKYDESQE